MSDSFLWAEKFRPRTFEDFVGQKTIVESVKNLVLGGNLPHLMFAGPPGVGKSTLALIIARALFGEGWKKNFLELNASDERGIDVVRNKVKDFARAKAFDVPFKIIFLDECDALTREAQQALRRTMENFTGSCRFVLSCNYASKIIEPIQSRCVVYRFQPLLREDIFFLIDHIAVKESLEMDEKTKHALFVGCEGDCRRLINLLQAAASSGKKIDGERVAGLAGLSQPSGVKEMLELALKGDLVSARKLLHNLVLSGLSGVDVVKFVHKAVWSLNADDKTKLRMIEFCGETEFRMVEGSDDFIQLEALLARFGLLRA